MRPIPAEEFSNLVGAIYDCALDPALWPGVLEALRREMAFRTSSLILGVDSGARALLDITAGITAEERAELLRHGTAAVEAWGPPGTLAALPLDTPFVRSRVNPAAHASRYVREQCRPRGYVDNLSIMFSRDSDSFCVLSFNRHRDEGAIGDAEVELARLSLIHI